MSFLEESASIDAIGTAQPAPITFYGIREPVPGREWKTLFESVWPAYRRWYLTEGDAARPSLAEASRMLERHMPELMPSWDRLRELADDDLASRMLTLWNPPAVLAGCSQAVLADNGPTLIRNYDYRPDLCERVVYSSRLTGRSVIGTSDCLWGLLDGMNDAGLAVSLAFGGRRDRGVGFGIPLVVRYLLEVCDTVAEAIDALDGLPVHMAYNLTVVDRRADVATIFVAPGTSPEVIDSPVATNHRGELPDDPVHARAFRSVERRERLLDQLSRGTDVEAVLRGFLQLPVYNTEYDRGFGTIYTAVYRLDDAVVDYVWPDSRWRRTFDSPSGTHAALLASRDVAWRQGISTEPTEPTVGIGRTGYMARAERPRGRVPSSDELAETAAAAVRSLADSGDPAAFSHLLQLSQLVGEAIGDCARNIAEHSTWAGVADLAGTSRQAAWERWRKH